MVALIWSLPRVFPLFFFSIVSHCVISRCFLCKKVSSQWLQWYGLSPVCVFWCLSRLPFYMDGMIRDLCSVYNLVVKKILDWEILINMFALIQSFYSVLKISYQIGFIIMYSPGGSGKRIRVFTPFFIYFKVLSVDLDNNHFFDQNLCDLLLKPRYTEEYFSCFFLVYHSTKQT